MTDYWLRVEAVNLGSFISDTNQISVVRGGGLRLLTELNRVLTAVLPGGTWKPVSTGASMVLLRCSQKPDVPRIEAAFRSDRVLKHATVLAAACEADDTTFVEQTEGLLGEIRFKQMRSPSLAFPAMVKGCKAACEDDHLRPAAKGKQSASVQSRFERGQEARQTLAAEIAKVSGINFTDDLNALAADRDRGNLDGKMAVFYADGNSFGSVRRKHCKSAAALSDWDMYIQGERASLLKSILTEANRDPGFKTGGLLRFETLLWGGDELLWVVPAWRGLRLVEMFYRLTKGWTFGGDPLTHAAGLVFCHRNAPIARIRSLAHDLCERAKEATHRKANAVAYQILESFDHTGADLDKYLKERTPKVLKASSTPSDPFVFSPEKLADALALGPHREEMSRKKVYEIKECLASGRSVGDENGAPLATAAQRELRDEDKTTLAAALAAFAPVTAAPPDTASHQWFVLSELWDYLVDDVEPLTTTTSTSQEAAQ